MKIKVVKLMRITRFQEKSQQAPTGGANFGLETCAVSYHDIPSGEYLGDLATRIRSINLASFSTL